MVAAVHSETEVLPAAAEIPLPMMPLPVTSVSTLPACQKPIRLFQLFIVSDSKDRRKSRLAPLDYIALANSDGLATFADGLPAGARVYFQLRDVG